MSMQIRRTNRLAARAGLLAALSAALGAHAVDAPAAEPEHRSMTVRYADLNLSTREGVDSLHRRIKSAAQIVCGGNDEMRDPILAMPYQSCVSAATSKALEKVQLATTQVRWQEK